MIYMYRVNRVSKDSISTQAGSRSVGWGLSNVNLPGKVRFMFG